MMRGVKRHLPDLAAVTGIILLSLLVAGYILAHQRFYLPNWVPLLGKDLVTITAEFETAQSVMPGQGQTVAIAGVPIGDITKTRLVNGHAEIEMKIQRRFAPIYRDATMLLRPKTALNDMFIQLERGTKAAGALKAGEILPLANSQPNVNPDEFFAMLDADTRDYLALLINGGAGALKGRGKDLGQVFRQLSVTAEQGHKITSLLSARRNNIARSIHNFRLVAEELGDHKQDVASWVDSANALFATYGKHEQEIRSFLAKAPSALNATASALNDSNKLLTEAEPALKTLRPMGRDLGKNLRQTRPFLRSTMPIIRDRLRPFARETLPLVKIFAPASKDLKELTPSVTGTGKSLNRILDIMSYNPPGSEEGYMFWLSWLNHNGASIFGLQDAHAPVRRGVVLAACNDLQVAEVVGKASYDQLRLILGLTGLPKAQDCR